MTLGLVAVEASARESVVVPFTRLERIRIRAVAVQRWASGSPARLTTASTPSSPRGSSFSRSGSHEISSGPRAGRRTSRLIRVTACFERGRKGGSNQAARTGDRDDHSRPRFA